MNCLLCGHKLAIFRRLSLGDFCCQEHRALFLREQSDQGLARLVETKGEPPKRKSATRVYAQFLPAGPPARDDEANSMGHGPLALRQLATPEAFQRSLSRLAPARMISLGVPPAGKMAPVSFGFAAPRIQLPLCATPVWTGVARIGLSPAGLILPWSSAAGSHTTLSLAPLVAAAWARSGYSEPIAPRPELAGGIQFAWPSVQGKVELPAPVFEIPVAEFATVETPSVQPMRVRISMPPVAVHKPKLAMPGRPPIEDLSQEAHARVAVTPQPKTSFLDSLLAPRSRTVRVRPLLRRRQREEIFGYDEPAPVVSSAAQGWRMMFAGLTPSAGFASAVFAVLFLVSAAGIFLSAPAALSERPSSWRWGDLRNAIRGRAVLKVEDNFSSGLNHWIGPAGWAQDWSFDRAGFVRPGKLGFLQQSMKLVNYRLELMGQIERKSLGWAFRAQDERNYYVAKLTIAKPGPLPMVDLIHFPVTDGKEGPKIHVSLPFSVRNDTLYQIEMNVIGDHFRASVNGHVVDSWSDNRLRAGGVGFVTGQGEASRVRWIRVSDKDDIVGRVCSYLSARYRPSGDPELSASYYTILRPSFRPADF